MITFLLLNLIVGQFTVTGHIICKISDYTLNFTALNGNVILTTVLEEGMYYVNICV